MDLTIADVRVGPSGLVLSSFTHFAIERGSVASPVTIGLERLGRGVLGVNAWRLLGLTHIDPMTGPHRAAWAAFVRRDPERAIAAWARIRGESDVNAGEVLDTLKNARELDRPGTLLN